MKLTQKLTAGFVAGALALCMTACSGSSANINALINQKLEANGSSYTVESFSADTNTVSLIEEAADAYANYKASLTNTDDLADDLEDDGYASTSSRYVSEMNIAKGANRTVKNNFDQSLASFSARGIGKAYQITSADVAGGLDNEEAVAEYVAGLVSGNAKVYVSDVIAVPTLDDAGGTYTGNCTYMRYVYIEYTGD